MTFLSNVITPSNLVTLTGVATLTNKTIGVSQLSGNVAVANGGTGTSNPGLSGNVLTSDGTTLVSKAPVVTTGKSFAHAMIMGF
jgi:hypothetical protein